MMYDEQSRQNGKCKVFFNLMKKTLNYISIFLSEIQNINFQIALNSLNNDKVN